MCGIDGLLGLTDRFESAFADDHDVRLRPFRARHLGVLRDSATLVADVVTRRVDGLRRVHHIIEATKKPAAGARLLTNCGEVAKKVEHAPKSIDPASDHVCDKCRRIAQDPEVPRPKGTKSHVVVIRERALEPVSKT
jgi:hypothetical protein